MIIQDLIDHRHDPVEHSLVVTGPDPTPLELPGPSVDTDAGVVIQRHDLRTTQEEADTIIVQQVHNHHYCVIDILFACTIVFDYNNNKT